MKIINGGVCAPKGFLSSGVHCGIRKNRDKKDLALIYSENIANVASVYTLNEVKGAPIIVTKENIKDGKAQAIICNSGNANTCNADGIYTAKKMCELVSNELNIKPTDVVVASTGVIGVPLDINPISKAMPNLIESLGGNSKDTANAIMTTDTKIKEIALEFYIGDKLCKIGGIAKGSGMIYPDMATMLVFITTDCAISSKMLQKALSTDVNETFNMLSVDGDTSTNDMVTILANGKAENIEITEENEHFNTFMKALNTVNIYLSRCIAGDGEGATKLLECKVFGASNKNMAKNIAKSIICSSLVKTAMFGSDANWGRILCAIGYSKENVKIDKIDVSFKSKVGEIQVCKNGNGVAFDEDLAKKILLEEDIEIIVNLNDGYAYSTSWGCDLTYDYVKINGDYRT